MALSQGGGIHMVVGVLVTYGIIQFLQILPITLAAGDATPGET